MAINDDIIRKLEGIRNLPTLPAIIQKLRNCLLNPNSDAGQVAKIIEDDPAMMLKILKVVNSAFFGSSEPITSIRHAVARMGFTSVSNVALSTSVFAAYGRKGEAGFNREEFWRHSISTGIAAEVLYDRCRQNIKSRYNKDVLHLSGLLHDIGKIIFEQYFHEQFLNAVKDCKERNIPLFLMEIEHISADHAQIGAWLGKKWGLSTELQEVIRWHHEPDNANAKYIDLVMLCHTANYICNLEKIGDSGDSTAPAFFHSVWKRLGLEIKDVPTITEQIREESQKSELLLALFE